MSKHFDPESYTWQFACRDLLGRRWPFLLWHALGATAAVKDVDIVFSHGPQMCLYTALALRLRRIRRPHIATTFNHGNGRFFRRLQLLLARAVLQDVELFVTHSQYERRLLADRYHIPLSRMNFSHWGVRRHPVRNVLPEYLSRHQPYVCCVGRNNRDFALFARASAAADVNAVIVCRRGQVDRSLLSSRIILREDLTEEDTAQVLAGSIASVIPLKDASTGAGHMTIVNAMLAGRAVILTELPTVTDYFFHGQHGRYVRQGSLEDLTVVLREVAVNPKLAEDWGKNAREFAERWLTEEAAAESLRAILQAFESHTPYPLDPPGWRRGIETCLGLVSPT